MGGRKIKTLTVFYSVTIKIYQGEYYCNGSFGRFFSTLTSKYQKVFLCAPAIEVSTKPNDYKILTQNWELQRLPAYSSYKESIKYFPKVLYKIWNYSKEWSSLYIRFPSPFSLMTALVSKIRGINFILHVVGDTKVIVKQGTKYKGLIKILADVYCVYHDYSIKVLMLLSNGTLYNGSGMRRLYRESSMKIKEVRTSTFEDSEIYYREDDGYSNLLFVGYLRHEKGLPILIEALTLLPNTYRLTIVGDGPEKDKIESIVKNNPYIKERVVFKGHIPIGKELFEEYKRSNIFILPSISEGTPRVVVEAMAFGNLVVASNTGGIPFTVKNNVNGLLFQVESPKDLAEKISLLEKNAILRSELRSGGYNLAKANTINSHINEVYEFIEKKISNIR